MFWPDFPLHPHSWGFKRFSPPAGPQENQLLAPTSTRFGRCTCPKAFSKDFMWITFVGCSCATAEIYIVGLFRNAQLASSAWQGLQRSSLPHFLTSFSSGLSTLYIYMRCIRNWGSFKLAWNDENGVLLSTRKHIYIYIYTPTPQNFGPTYAIFVCWF